MLQLDGQDGGLDPVEAAVDPLDLVDVLLERAVVGEEAGLAGEGIVVRDQRPRVAVGAEVFPGIEAERPGQAEGPRRPAVERREVRLGAVLDHGQAVRPAIRRIVSIAAGWP